MSVNFQSEVKKVEEKFRKLMQNEEIWHKMKEIDVKTKEVEISACFCILKS